jgi:hypothetical protein
MKAKQNRGERCGALPSRERIWAQWREISGEKVSLRFDVRSCIAVMPIWYLCCQNSETFKADVMYIGMLLVVVFLYQKMASL